MTIIDSHSHIYLQEFDADRPAVVERAGEEGVSRILMPAVDAGTHRAMLDTEEAFPGICRSMMGLHPCSVKEDFREELRIAREWLERRPFVAVGETGLDFYWDLSFKEQQYEAFREQIGWALHWNIPVVIHSRNSIDECIELVAEQQKGNLKGVFHCFSGNAVQTRKIMDLGFYMGIGGVVSFKNAGLDAVVKETGLGRVVLETDAPYLAPVPFRGKRNEPAYLKYVVGKLAGVLELGIEEVAAVTTANAEELFGKI